MKAKLQTPRRLQGQEQVLPSSSNSISTASSIRVSKKSNYSFTKNQRQSSSLKKSSRVESMLQDSQCIALRKQLESSLDDDDNKNSGKLDFSHIETNQLNRLISHLREYSQHCAVEGNYDQARQAEFLGSKAKSVLEKRTTKIKPTVKIVEEQKESRINFEQRWRNKFNEYENETNLKREKLKKKHDHETRVFERIWAQEMPQKYRKPSHNLLQLMQIEKSLAISGEIDRADYIHSQVVKQTQIEMENAQSNLIHDYQIARSKHIEKQSIEMSRFEQTRKHGKDLLDADYKVDMQRVNHRDLVVKVQVKESILKAKMDQTPPTRSAGVPKNRDSTIASLLPRLVAPNDPSIIKNEKIKKKQIYGKQQEFQRKTIESLQAESSSNRKQNRSDSYKSSFINSNDKENLPNDIKPLQKGERKRRKSSKNKQGTRNIDNDFSENDYYYSDDSNTAPLYNENGIVVNQNTKAATPMFFDNPHYNSPMSSEQNGINNNRNFFFESSATMLSDTYQKVGFQTEDEAKNNEDIKSNDQQNTDQINDNNQNIESIKNDENNQNTNECNTNLNDNGQSKELKQNNENIQSVESKPILGENNQINEISVVNQNRENDQFNEINMVNQNSENNQINEISVVNQNRENDQSNESNQDIKYVQSENVHSVDIKENKNNDNTEICQESIQSVQNDESCFDDQKFDTNDFDFSSSNIQSNIEDAHSTSIQDATSKISNDLLTNQSNENDLSDSVPQIISDSNNKILSQVQDITTSIENQNDK